jgi:hypothetical protein
VRAGRQWLLLASLLAACQPFAGAGSSGRLAAARSAPTPLAPAATSQSTNANSPNAAQLGARQTVGGLLGRPKTPSVTLQGQVLVDASYVVSAGTGSLISNNGGAILAAGATRFAGGGLISDKGSGLVANNSGNLIDTDGNSVISDHSSGIISENGGALISDKGAGAAANVVSDRASTQRPFGVLNTEASPTTAPKPVYGTQLPAAGMQIGVLSLATHQRLPLGSDSAGNPVYSVFTNLSGGFQIYIPAAEQANVLVLTNVPATTDVRQHYDLLVPTQSKSSQVLDEDTALVSRYVRTAFVSRLAHLLVDDPNVAICAIDSADVYTGPLATAMTDLVRQIHNAALKAGVHGNPVTDPAVRALATRCADVTLARLDLSTFKLDKTTSPYWGEHNPHQIPQPVTEAMVTVLKAVREKATFRLATEPGFFEQEPYFKTAVACKPVAYSIKKPADVNTFIVDEFMSTNTADAIEWAKQILLSMDVGEDEFGTPYGLRLGAASNAVVGGFSLAFIANQGGVQDLVLKLIAAFDPVQPLATGEPAPPIGQEPCPRPFPTNFATPTPSGAAGEACATTHP